MTGFLHELSKKAAERWVNLLILPAVLWTATLLVVTRLRHERPTTIRPIIDVVADWTGRPHSATELVVVLLGLLLVSAAASLTVIGLAVLVRHAWVTPGERLPARCLTNWRQNRWIAHHQSAKDLAIQAAKRVANEAQDSTHSSSVRAPGFAEALARRDAISLEPPQRPTWIGDCWRSTYTRVYRAYGLDLTIVWPRLWAVLPDNLRTDITAAHTAYNSASTLTAWAVLYIIPAILWWPILLIALTIVAVAIVRARTATTTLCQLIETATDLHAHTLAAALQPPNPDIGNIITARLREQPGPTEQTSQ